MNRPTPSSSSGDPTARPGLLSGFWTLLGGLLRLAAGVLAFVLMLGALLVGAALALGLVAWALLRGRRPQAQVFGSAFQRMRRGPRPTRGHGSDPWRSAAPAGAVVDVEAREVPDDGRAKTTLQSDR